MEYKDIIFNYLSQFCLVSRGKPLQTPTDPYIELSLVEDNFGSSFIQGLPIYDVGTAESYGNIADIVKNIENDITESGKLLINEDCNVKIYKGSPFYQDREMGEENVRAGYINLQITIFKKGV